MLSIAEIVEPTYGKSIIYVKVAVILILPMFSEAPRGASPKQFSMVYGKGERVRSIGSRGGGRAAVNCFWIS